MHFKPDARVVKLRNFIIILCKPFVAVIGLLTVFNLYMAVALSVRPYFLKQIINNVYLYDHTASISIFIPIFIYLFISITNISFMRLNDYIQNIKLIPNLTKAIAMETTRLALLSPYFFNTYQQSEKLTESITDIIHSVSEVISVVINKFVYLFFAILVGIIVLYSVTPLFSIILLSWIILVSFVLYCSLKKISSLSQNVVLSAAKLKHNIFDILTNIISVRLNNSEYKEQKYIEHILDESISSQKKTSMRHLWMWVIYGYSFICMLCINLFLLVEYKKLNIVSVGDFALVLSINIIIFDTFWTIFRDSLSFVQALGKIRLGLDCITKHFGKNNIITDRVNFPTKGNIKYSNVCLNTRDKIILDNINTSIILGQKIAIVGSSGSGKSSFVNLLIGLLSPNSGKITCGNVEVPYRFISDNICFISPNTMLFDRSIYENIAYSDQNVNVDDVLKAAQLTEAHDFILNMPEGYNTILSKNGVKLSTGQRQRILLARAILKKSSITILDEAMSHLDYHTELKILNNFLQILHNKTLIVITHRLRNIYFADKVIVFKNGKILTEGSPRELYSTGVISD
jgi:ATP-binding cassette subfamily B protein